MQFPKGQIVYEDLGTAYTQFDALLEDLQSNHFTGYLKIAGWQYEGILLLANGDVVNAIDETEGQRRSGPAAAQAIAAKAHEKNSTITVCRLSSEMAHVLSGLCNGQAIYRDLESDFTSLDRLVDKLKGEKHTGYVEIRATAGRDVATIFMREGKTVECLWVTDGDVQSGPEILPQILQATASLRTLFTVYRTDPAPTLGKGLAAHNGFSRQDVLSLWQAVLQQVEATANEKAGPETFQTAFRRACIGHADQYPFLDPFAAEFEYSKGEIKFNGQESLADLNEGLRVCLWECLTELTAGSGDASLMAKLAPAAADITSKYGPLLAEVGLASVLPALFGDA